MMVDQSKECKQQLAFELQNLCIFENYFVIIKGRVRIL